MPDFIQDWTQQHIVLTGAQGGLGEALAEQLSQKRALVTLVGRRREALQSQAGRLGQRYLECDLSSEAGIDQLTNYLETSRPKVTGVLHCAGISHAALFADSAWPIHQEIMQFNAILPMRVTHLALAVLRQRDKSWLLHVGSVFGAMGFPAQSSYCASKAALARFCEALQREQDSSSPRIMYAAPRAIATSMNAGVMHELNQLSKTKEDAPAFVAQPHQANRARHITTNHRLA